MERDLLIEGLAVLIFGDLSVLPRAGQGRLGKDLTIVCCLIRLCIKAGTLFWNFVST